MRQIPLTDTRRRVEPPYQAWSAFDLQRFAVISEDDLILAEDWWRGLAQPAQRYMLDNRAKAAYLAALYATGRNTWRLSALLKTLNRSAAGFRIMAADVLETQVRVARWQGLMWRNMRSAHLAAGALAVGGWEALAEDAEAQAMIGERLRIEYAFLLAFTESIARNNLPHDKRTVERAAMYALAAYGTFFLLVDRLEQQFGRNEYRNILGKAEKHCDGAMGCIGETLKGWQPLGALIPIGSRTCLSHCRCTYEYRQNPTPTRAD